MIVRKCAYDHDIVIHKNTKPNMLKTIELADGSRTTITYPNSYKYFLVVGGAITQRSNSFNTIEKAYIDKCSETHGSGHGHIDIVKHKLVNNKVVNR